MMVMQLRDTDGVLYENSPAPSPKPPDPINRPPVTTDKPTDEPAGDDDDQHYVVKPSQSFG